MKKFIFALVIGLTLIGVATYVAVSTSTPAQAAGCDGGGC